MTGLTRKTPAFALAVWTIVGGVIRAEDPDAVTAALRRAYVTDAEGYGFERGDDDRTSLKFRSKPIMHWASDNDWSGDVFVWTHEGRPEAVGCMLSGPVRGGRYYYHEFHTLAPVPLTMTESTAAKRWSPKQGVSVRSLAAAPVPSTTERGRMLQLRALARTFTAKMKAGDQEWKLRLLPQPLHRYASEGAGVVDGAIFAFVWGTGTDPEMLLAIEARKDDDGKTSWTYLPIQFTNRPTTLLDGDDREVWSRDAYVEPSGDSNAPYATFYARHTPAPTSEDED